MDSAQAGAQLAPSSSAARHAELTICQASRPEGSAYAAWGKGEPLELLTAPGRNGEGGERTSLSKSECFLNFDGKPIWN